jgi:hypothetical protein
MVRRCKNVKKCYNQIRTARDVFLKFKIGQTLDPIRSIGGDSKRSHQQRILFHGKRDPFVGEFALFAHSFANPFPL